MREKERGKRENTHLLLATELRVLCLCLLDHAHNLFVNLLGDAIVLRLDLLQALHRCRDVLGGEIEVAAGHAEELLLLFDPRVGLGQSLDGTLCVLEVLLPRLELVHESARLDAGVLLLREGCRALLLQGLDFLGALVELGLLAGHGGLGRFVLGAALLQLRS